MYIDILLCSCGTFENQSSICFSYVNNDVYNHNQSNQITKALENVINIVNGSYCRERITEFLCNYYFPHCENNANITPICEQSCYEYLYTGICRSHFFNLLNALIDGNYLNISENTLLHCSLPYNITFSNNCTLLTGKHTRYVACQLITVPLSLNLTLARVCRCSRSQILPGNSRVTRERTINRSS